MIKFNFTLTDEEKEELFNILEYSAANELFHAQEYIIKNNHEMVKYYNNNYSKILDIKSKMKYERIDDER
jgi:hypothetical protein